MTIRAAPAASGVNTLPLSTLTATTKVRKNAPIASTAYLRTCTAHSGAATTTDFGSLVMTFAICFLLEFAEVYSTIPRMPSRRHRRQRPFIPPGNRTRRIPASCNMLVTQLFCARRGSLEAITGRAMERRRYCAASTADCAQLPVGTPFVLGGAAPDTSVAAVQRPLQTRCGHRARPAYLPGFLDLKQGGTRCAEGKEQVRIDVAAGGVVTPVRIRGVSLPLE